MTGQSAACTYNYSNTRAVDYIAIHSTCTCINGSNALTLKVVCVHASTPVNDHNDEIHLVDFFDFFLMYLGFTRTPGESYGSRFQSMLWV